MLLKAPTTTPEAITTLGLSGNTSIGDASSQNVIVGQL